MRITGIDEIAREKRVFTKGDALRLLGIKEGSVAVTLSRLERAGWIERIERGKYMVIPLGERKGQYTVNEFLLASILAPTGSIAYWSSLNYHGLTEQIPTTVFVQTTKKKKRASREIFGVRYRFVLIKKERYFGLEEIWIGEDRVRITDPEKTVIDCLDLPQYCGGVIEAAKAIKSKLLDPDRLKDHAVRFGSSAVIRRLGYLCEIFGADIDLPPIVCRNYVYLDPTLPKRGENSARWRLKVNLDLGGLE